MLLYLNIFGVKISSYGLCMLFGILIVALFSIKRGKQKNIRFEDVIIIIAFIIAFFMLGAWVLYMLVTFSVRDIINMISQKHYLFLGSGGLVFYGGLIGGIIGSIIGVKVSKIKVSDAEEILVPYIPLGHSVGRIGCFLAGCCRGIEYYGSFSVKGRFPIQLFESILNVLICITLLVYRKRKRKTYDLLFLYILEYSSIRFFTEYLRGDLIRGLYFNLSTSQWISIVLIFISCIYYTARRYKV